MQTFLPYANFADSAACLDRQRLGKQRVEAKQILMTLEGKVRGWRSHPAVRMWQGYADVLALYGWTVCTEWRRRGYIDTLRPYFGERVPKQDFAVPAWLGNEEFHLAHRANLVRKLPEWYGKLWPDVGPSDEYVWPES